MVRHIKCFLSRDAEAFVLFSYLRGVCRAHRNLSLHSALSSYFSGVFSEISITLGLPIWLNFIPFFFLSLFLFSFHVWEGFQTVLRGMGSDDTQLSKIYSLI